MLALSMYSTLPALERRARAGVSTAPNFLKRVGDRYVQVALIGTGRQTEVSRSGHFDFHEYTNFNYSASINLAGIICL